jgi:hypothetical protein
MSKNMTQKGLALGAGFALISASLLAVPATAAGINNDSVSLLPNAGAEYNMIAGGTLVLKSNMASGVAGSGQYLKFLVEDSAAESTVTYSQSTQLSDLATTYTAVASNNKVTLAGLTAHKFKVGDEIEVTGFDDVAQDALNSFTVAAAEGGTQASTSVKDIDTVTIGGLPRTGDIITVTITPAGDAAQVYAHTVVADDTLAETATAVAALVNAGADTTATASAGVITITGAANDDAIATAVGAVETVVVADTNIARATITDIEAATISYIGGAIEDDTTTVTDGGTVKLLSSTPALGSYVFDTKTDVVTGDKLIAIASTDKNVTQTVTVTAWIDSNDDGDIDTTEYQSPARTLNFLASTAIATTTSVLAAYEGQSTVQASVAFAPTLNGSQLIASYNRNGAANAVQGHFSRPGSAEEFAAATVTYSNTSKLFTLTSVNLNATSGTPVDTSGSGWGITQPTSSLKTQSVTIKSLVATVTTSTSNYASGSIAVHGLKVGDVLTTASMTTGTADKSGAIVTSVPTTTTFTYAVAAGTVDVAATTQSAGTISVSKIVNNFVVPGTYSVQALLWRNDATLTDALIDTGSAAGLTVGSTTSTSADLEGVPSTTVNAAGKVLTGTTSGSAVLSVVDVKGNPVAAGTRVAITATRVTGSGTQTVNGTTLVGTAATAISAVTDASGQVAIAFTNSLGAAADRIDLATNVQGVTDTLSIIWEGAVYSIFDRADSSTDSAARNRVADANGSYTFDLVVLDQFKNVPGATVRLLATITGRTTQTTPVTLSAGNASVTVATDGSAVTGDTTVKMNFQKQSSLGVWTTQNGADAYVDWFASENNDLAPVLIKFYSQTDKVNLNADAANFPSSTAADFAADVTVLAYNAVDTRLTSGVATAYTAATKATVSGNVANASTGVAKAGAVVTVSGAGLLFNSGGVWAADSISFITNDGTYAVDVVSTTSGKKVVTVTSGAVSATATVTYTAVSAVTGYSVKLTTPATVQSGSTYRVEGQVLDINGNGIVLTTAGTGTNPTLSVTYMGLGLVSGSLPTTTDASGKFYFYVLVGSNDVGTATVTASYDADGTATTSAAVSASSVVYIGQSAPAVASDTKVNVGSFKGYVALYAKGYKGKKMSAIVAGKWIVVASLASDFERVVRYTGAGYDIVTTIYIDGVKVETFNVTTK